MDFPKKQQQCLIPRYLLQYLQDLQISHNDPTAPWGGGGGGGSYTAGTGIDITNDVISVDSTVVALKSDLSDYVTTSELTTELSNYVTSTDLATELLDYAELSDLSTVATTGDYNDLLNKPTIPTKTSDLTNDSGYITTSELTTELSNYVTSTDLATELLDYAELSDLATVARTGSYNDLSNKPSIPTKTSDLTNDSGYITSNNLSNYVTLNGVQTISGSKNFTGLTTFQGTHYDVYFGQSTGFNVSDKNNPAQESMSVYPGFLSAHRYTGNTTLDGNFFLGNHYFCAYNSDTEYKIKLVNKGGATTYGEYTFKNKTGDVAITSEIPTATSDLTNDSGYITSSALTGYATESWVTNQGYSTFSGSYNDLTNKPDLSIYELAADAFSGDYNDLINKPTIPDAVSGTNDGTNWTSITIGNTTHNIPSGGGSAPSNMVTTNTTQTISGSKTFNNTVTFSGSNNTTGNVVFTGRNPIKMIASSGSGSSTGFTLFNSNNYEKGYLQYIDRQDALYLGRWWGLSSPKYAQNIGFLSESGGTGYRVLMPNKTSTGSSADAANTYYIPTEITNGTTTVKASSDGIIDISSLISGGGGGTTVTGTNDGTNWTSLTINGSTYNIPAGGSSSGGSSGGSAGNGAIYYHNVRLAFAGSNSNYGKTIEFSILTKSATQILTMNELISQVSALQNVAYNDSVVGVIYGQVYQYNNRNNKEQILGFGLTGTSSNPNFYAVVRNNSGRSSDVSISATNSTSFIQTINWINNLQNLRGSEQAANCYDIVTGGSGGSSMSNYIIRFIGNGSGTNCDVSIRCTLKDNSTLVPGIYNTFDDTDMDLVDYLNAALVGITTYDYASREFAIFTEFYFADTTTLKYDEFEIAEIKISQLAY